MYIVTGGAGFIGSAFVAHLNRAGINNILVVDEIGTAESWRNLRCTSYAEYLHKDEFLKCVKAESLPCIKDPREIKAIIHMGACSTTTELDMDYLMRNNFHYSVALAEFALKHGIRFIYASSAATYGAGEQGYSDNHEGLRSLRPLNRYGYSKQVFDTWVLGAGHLNKVAGLKFFNVYGPNEYHKGGQRSVVVQAYEQIKKTGKVRLFKSYRPDFKDGEQRRDFVYIKDCCAAMWWLLQHERVNGIFNLGTGRARTWNDLARAVFSALDIAPKIEYIDMPEEIRVHYQYSTEADMSKLRVAGFDTPFAELEDGVRDYVRAYLEKNYAHLEG